jgi:hypothetical protein
MSCIYTGDAQKVMSEYADLEIGLHRRDEGSYAVEFRFSPPGSEAVVSIGHAHQAQVSFDLEALRGLAYDPQAYGLKLTHSLFGDPAVRSAFAQARASVQSLGVPLRLRLYVGPSAPSLHNLHWETLRDPEDNSPLSTSENLVFSRYMSSMDWRPVRLRSKGELRALVLIANPSGLQEYNLAPIDVGSELERARAGLGQVPLAVLPNPDGTRRATLNNLIDHLRDTDYDILYLVCHGTLAKDEPWLWLEDEAGAAARLPGGELVARLNELAERPRLVVLASCESAGSGSGSALLSLGPKLAQAGIPAVLAMQGQISVRTLSGFMPVFFRELQRDGQIDRAAAVARGAVRQENDHWMPALFMRLRSGRIWYVPGFGDERDEFEKWQSLAGFIHDQTCTPILGPGIAESLLGSQREIALRWAEKHGFPLALRDRDVLPRVAQYVITSQSPAYLPIGVREAVRDELQRRYADDLPDDLRHKASWTQADMEGVMKQVATKYWQDNPQDPYRLLAQLRLPLYITAGTQELMKLALQEAGADPVVRVCPWNKWIPKENSIYEETPTSERPLLYHLFGNVSVPMSLVYAEDRYFDYLIGVTLNKRLIPSVVRAALNSTSLLFLGFQMDDWEFRVFFRFLMAQEGRERLKFYSHVAAQIEPEEDRILDLKRARKYLEEYYESENISTYWGSPGEFLKALWGHL